MSKAAEIQATCAHVFGQQINAKVRIDPRDGQPDERWWHEQMHLLNDRFARDAYPSESTTSCRLLGPDDVPSVGLSIQDNGPPLVVFVVTFEPIGCELRLRGVSHAAQLATGEA